VPRGFSNHILVVDDDDAVRWTIGAVLREAGHSVTLCANGGDALVHLRQTEFDVVLTDLRLGDIDGLQVLDAARRTWPDTVTLLLTGYASVESAIAALRHGVYDYLCKPCAPEELLATIERALERRHLTQQVRLQMRSLETAIDTARELHSALSSRLEGTTALLREREHVLVTICTELRTSLIAIAGLVDILLARGRDSSNDDLPEYLERIRAEARALAERVNGALQITRSESVELPADESSPVELVPITLESVPATVSQ
jgi:DNA-binding response OmpR family regulator